MAEKHFKGLMKFDIPVYSPEWYKFRTTGIANYDGGIGASEIATVLGIAYKYDTQYGIWQSKVDIESSNTKMNERMFNGIEDESRITEMWCCYDQSTKEYIDLYMRFKSAMDNLEKTFDDKFPMGTYKLQKELVRKKNVVRDGFKPSYYLANPSYPWLFCSLDFWCDEGFPVECKTIGWDRARAIERIVGRYGDSYELCGIGFESLNNGSYRPPIEYEAQFQQQMLITESDYLECAMLIDEHFVVNMYKRNDDFCIHLATESRKFWETVLEARERLQESIYLRKEGRVDEAKECEDEILALAPGGGKEGGYAEMMSSVHQPEHDLLQPVEQDVKLIKKYELLYEISKAITDDNGMLREIKNKFIERLVKGKANRIKTDIGTVDYKKFNYKSKNKDAYITGYSGSINPDVLSNVIKRLDDISNNL